MYDTIEGSTSIEGYSIAQRDDLIKRIDIRRTVENEWGVTHKGSFNGFRVTVGRSKLGVSGSLPKIHLGNNIKTIDREGAKDCLCSLSEALGVDISAFQSTRIDVAQNMLMRHPVPTYLQKLGSLKRYKRLEQQNGIYYETNKEQLVFYGKVKEQKAKRIKVDEIWQDKHIFRYEQRYRKQLLNKFNLPSLPFNMLYEEAFYIRLLNLWKERYFQIRKQRSPIPMIATTSPKEFVEMVASTTINTHGEKVFLDMVLEWQRTAQVNKQQAYELRKKIKSLGGKEAYSMECELINELDEKVIKAHNLLLH